MRERRSWNPPRPVCLSRRIDAAPQGSAGRTGWLMPNEPHASDHAKRGPEGPFASRSGPEPTTATGRAPYRGQSIRSYAGSVRNSTKVSLLTRSAKIVAASSYLPSPNAGAEQLADLLHLLGDHRGDHLLRHLAAVVELALRRADPLPDLRARDLGGRRVLHQVVDRHRALPRQPRADVLDRDVDVEAQALLGDRLLGLELEEVGRGHLARRRASWSRSGSARASAGRTPPARPARGPGARPRCRRGRRWPRAPCRPSPWRTPRRWPPRRSSPGSAPPCRPSRGCCGGGRS